MTGSAGRMAGRVAAVALMAAGGLFLWLTFFPSGLGQIFGDDEFEPLSGFLFLGISALASMGVLRWSRWRWLAIALTGLGVVFWVPFALNTTPPGPSVILVGLYLVAAAGLAVSLALER